MKIMIIFEIADNELIRDKFNNIISNEIGLDKVKFVKELSDDSHLKNHKVYNYLKKKYKEFRDKKEEFIINNPPSCIDNNKKTNEGNKI